LVLAHVGRAQALITGDGDVLALRDSFPGLIVTPDEWAARHKR
ncbi:PIN domain nuclease, partial [Burkholderia sola]